MFLKLVKPYLIIKKDQAEVCLIFQATVKRDGLRLTQDILDEREKLYQRTKELNKRGWQNAI